MNKVYWSGKAPKYCDLTRAEIKDVFIDGRTATRLWAIMTPEAHAKFGLGLGMGRGQKYEKQPDGRWLKVAG